MERKTKSELLFEEFLTEHRIDFERVATADGRRPDYRAKIGVPGIMFEIKEIAEDETFINKPGEFKVYSTTVGQRIRSLIKKSRKQIQYGARVGVPSVLVIYNNMDPLQLVHTEAHDFIAAMYGEYTISINRKTGEGSPLFNGRKKSLTPEMNTSFAAVAHLCDRGGETTLTLYENIHAQPSVPFDALPSCIRMIRVNEE